MAHAQQRAAESRCRGERRAAQDVNTGHAKGLMTRLGIRDSRVTEQRISCSSTAFSKRAPPERISLPFLILELLQSKPITKSKDADGHSPAHHDSRRCPSHATRYCSPTTCHGCPSNDGSANDDDAANACYAPSNATSLDQDEEEGAGLSVLDLLMIRERFYVKKYISDC